MRRKRQMLPEEESIAILNEMTSGVLSVAGDDGYPYGVPVSYVYHEGRLYFQSAMSGHKIDAIRKNEKVSFCTIAKDEIIPERFTTHFRSVIAFGKIRIVEDEEEKLRILRMIARRYSPSEDEASVQNELDKTIAHVNILEMTVEHLTGKEAIELVRARETSEK